MSTKTSATQEAKIERLVREHLVAQQLLVKAAVERAFAARTASPDVATQRRRTGVRRPSSAVADLAERLLEAVQACPGETMAVLGTRMGERARALHRPMMRLKQEGRVRSAGERNATRYFSMGKKAA
ncbi:winged helix-turn-helix domain-containing protein [Myxococcus sp. MxC21-1]|uniref:winged helix-turn-helix domain-containing protein n=1 Tax=Myxococcus sp. MxC21-1 TaxID=3041439 RepID=UPI00292E2655|nr:winged helix-turn-helix domain-containing protein [Myxococcus sp. MxC21-1]WNZ65471.1 winged helix-turn-helix domain-containing protein [Myxococcus sp. MxC21-1]